MLRVGKAGDEGSVELTDLLFTAQGPTAGWIGMEWNLMADSSASAGMWGEYCSISVRLEAAITYTLYG